MRPQTGAEQGQYDGSPKGIRWATGCRPRSGATVVCLQGAGQKGLAAERWFQRPLWRPVGVSAVGSSNLDLSRIIFTCVGDLKRAQIVTFDHIGLTRPENNSGQVSWQCRHSGPSVSVGNSRQYPCVPVSWGAVEGCRRAPFQVVLQSSIKKETLPFLAVLVAVVGQSLANCPRQSV